jgi:quercetin dioxygenase-like cupin family protein
VKTPLMFLLLAFAALSLVAPVAAPAYDSMEKVMFLNPDDLRWHDPPPGIPAGAKVSVLLGDPTQPGPFVVRISTPGEFVIKPHYHSRAETLTVLYGTLYMGTDSEFDPAAAHTIFVGGFHYLPAKSVHFAFTKTPTVIELHGEGPFDIIYLKPGDDPRTAR